MLVYMPICTCTCRNTATALSAFELMDTRNISLNAIAVVDSEGKLVDVVSSADLKGV